MRFICILPIFTLTLVFFSSCHKEQDNEEPENYYTDFAPYRITIPEFLGSPEDGYDGYGHYYDGDKILSELKRYIGIGDIIAQYVENKVLFIYQFEEGFDTSYVNQDTVLIEYRKNVMFEDNLYEYYVTYSRLNELDDEPNEVIYQNYYNNEPYEGTIIYNNEIRIWGDFLYNDSTITIKARLDYKRTNTRIYDKEMEFSVENYSVSPEFPMDKFKFFVGIKDNCIDISGNFNLPNSQFLTEDVGFSCSFVASGDLNNQIGVYEIGLPPCSFNSSSRIEILEDHSALKVMSDQLIELNPSLNYNSVLHYLNHIIPPYYVNRDGFVNSDTLPNSTYITIRDRLPSLVPYNPSEIESLEVTFGE